MVIYWFEPYRLNAADKEIAKKTKFISFSVTHTFCLSYAGAQPIFYDRI